MANELTYQEGGGVLHGIHGFLKAEQLLMVLRRKDNTPVANDPPVTLEVDKAVGVESKDPLSGCCGRVNSGEDLPGEFGDLRSRIHG
jgi:hypothetical protein